MIIGSVTIQHFCFNVDGYSVSLGDMRCVSSHHEDLEHVVVTLSADLKFKVSYIFGCVRRAVNWLPSYTLWIRGIVSLTVPYCLFCQISEPCAHVSLSSLFNRQQWNLITQLQCFGGDSLTTTADVSELSLKVVGRYVHAYVPWLPCYT